MNYSSKPPYAETLSRRSGDYIRPWPIGARELESLIDLGWSDNRIAWHFGVEAVKVSALRAYYGLIGCVHDTWVRRMRRRNRLQGEE
jgi:hypothetical protein